MAESLFVRADEVIRLLGVSKSEAYRIIKRLNDEMASGSVFLSPNVRMQFVISLMQHKSASEDTSILRISVAFLITFSVKVKSCLAIQQMKRCSLNRPFGLSATWQNNSKPVSLISDALLMY